MYKTWKEIKEMFERNNVKDEDKIDYIDIMGAELEEDPTFDNSSGMWEIYT